MGQIYQQIKTIYSRPRFHEREVFPSHREVVMIQNNGKNRSDNADDHHYHCDHNDDHRHFDRNDDHRHCDHNNDHRHCDHNDDHHYCDHNDDHDHADYHH